jgi:hypothetical protein
MYLINSKTGKPVEVTDEDLKGYGSGEKPKRSSFGTSPKSKDDQTDRPSKLPQRTFEREEAPAQDGVPKITRSSDYKKKVPKTSFGTKKPAPGEYARRATRLSHSKNRSNRRTSMPDGSYPNGSIRQPYYGAS